MQRRHLKQTGLAWAASLLLLTGCDSGESPAPTEEQKKPEFAAQSVAKIQAAGSELQKGAGAKAPGLPGPGNMMKKNN
jgi:hypothetical protein